MKLVVVTTLWFTISSLLPLCTSLKNLPHSPNDQTHQVVLDLSKLPRKLRLTEVPLVRDSRNRDYKSNSAKSGALSGRPYDKAQIDMQQFLTMDYSRPRRRRPIHNRVVPAP